MTQTRDPDEAGPDEAGDPSASPAAPASSVAASVVAPWGFNTHGQPRKRPPRNGEGAAKRGLLTPRLLQHIARLSKAGLTEPEIRATIGVSDESWRRWHGKPVFMEALHCTGDYARHTERVERALLHRALGYSHETVKVMQHQGTPVIVPYVEHYPPDVEAAKTWLHNRAPDRWKPKVESGSGVTVVIQSQMILDALAGRDPSPTEEVTRDVTPTLERKP